MCFYEHLVNPWNSKQLCTKQGDRTRFLSKNLNCLNIIFITKGFLPAISVSHSLIFGPLLQILKFLFLQFEERQIQKAIKEIPQQSYQKYCFFICSKLSKLLQINVTIESDKEQKTQR